MKKGEFWRQTFLDPRKMLTGPRYANIDSTPGHNTGFPKRDALREHLNRTLPTRVLHRFNYTKHKLFRMGTSALISSLLPTI